MLRFRIGSLFGLVIVTASLGCSSGLRTYPVDGQLVFADGQPAKELAGYSIEFDPLSGTAGASGQVQTDGSFHLSTVKLGDGSPAGEFRVCLVPPPPGDIDRPPPLTIDRKYQASDTTPLRATVNPTRNQITLTVERRRKR